MKKLWIAGLSVCVFLTGCSVKNDKETVKLVEPVSSSYSSAVVVREDIYSEALYPAYVVPNTEELSFSEAGKIDEIKVISGDKVEKGQVLAKLDVSDINSQIEELEALIESTKENNEFGNTSAQYDIDIMKLELDELNKEYKAADTSAQKDLKLTIEIKKVDIKIAEEKLTQAKQLQEFHLKKQEQQLDDLSKTAANNTIKAPFSGEIISMPYMYLGRVVDAGEPVLIIADMTKLFLETEYTNGDIFDNCDRYFALNNNKELEISYVPTDIKEYLKIILSKATPTTKFEIKNNDVALPPGTYASVCVINDFKPDALTLPKEAVFTDSESSYVYLIDNGKKVRKSIETGIVTETSVEIVNGLEEGDVVYVKK